jgi:hypothetical protein
MLAPNPLRTALAEFLGDERFRVFARLGVGGHLTYPQERDLERFRAANPQLEFEMSDLEAALRICVIHEMDLLPCKIEVFRGHLNWNQRYLEAKRVNFPYAMRDRVMVREDFPGTHLDAWYCPTCRDMAAAWRDEY